MPRGTAWAVLTLVFVDEVLAVVALGAVGAELGGWPSATLLVVVSIGLWWSFASPKARWGGPVVRPVTKVVVFGGACAGLWWAGHPGLALALLTFSVVINALAQAPEVRKWVEITQPPGGDAGRTDPGTRGSPG